MEIFEKIGTYLNRYINYLNITDFNNIPLQTQKNSMLLILLNEEFISTQAQISFLNQLINLEPLGIVFWGKGDEVAWNKLIDILSITATAHHIMTYQAYGETLIDALEDTLYSKIPAGEMFNEWKDYSIISIGAETNEKKLICDYLEG